MNRERAIRKAEVIGLSTVLMLGVAACGAQGNFGSRSNPAASESARQNAQGFENGPWKVYAGTNLRYDAEKIENVDGSSNVCFSTEDTIEITVPAVQVLEEPVDGTWLGFNTAIFPDYVRQACDEDKDSTIWINDSLIDKG